MASRIEEILAASERRSLLRLSTAGSVDDGKSTLIGRLLHDSKAIYEDQLESIRGRSKQGDAGDLDFSLLTDGLRAEREQGITIDVAYRFFSTPKRHFILADTPGHVQYTRNMATGASTSQLAILLVDARHGVSEQTRRHAFISSLLGVPRIVVAVNKMDLVQWSEDRFSAIQEVFVSFARKLGVHDITFIPVSALLGDNIVHHSAHMPWYEGPALLSHLENVYIDSDTNLLDFRFPVQYVIRPHQDFRGFAGKIVSGTVRVGDEIMVLPAQKRSRIKTIVTFDGTLHEASAPQSVALTLVDEVDVSRGDMITRVNNVPEIKRSFEAMLIWMDGRSPATLGKPYRIIHCNRDIKCRISHFRYSVDVNSLSRRNTTELAINEIGRVEIDAQTGLFADSYRQNKATGNFILVDELTNATVAAGMILDRQTADSLPGVRDALGRNLPEDQIIFPEKSGISMAERVARGRQKPLTIWFTGLSGAGKSEIGRELERLLFSQNFNSYLLDGDTLRTGLTSDLGFSSSERTENIRRVAEVARLFNDAGMIAICALISPLESDREMARKIVGRDHFFEIFVSTPLDICEQRDSKGLYKRARSGEVHHFTGISAPYERPHSPDLELTTVGRTALACAEAIIEMVRNKILA